MITHPQFCAVPLEGGSVYGPTAFPIPEGTPLEAAKRIAHAAFPSGFILKRREVGLWLACFEQRKEGDDVGM